MIVKNHRRHAAQRADEHVAWLGDFRCFLERGAHEREVLVLRPPGFGSFKSESRFARLYKLSLRSDAARGLTLISTIVSGGQTGADTAALNFAIRHRIQHGGWCPRGRKREDGIIPSRYALRETPSAGYSQRTRWNVRDSDATAIFTLAETLKGGSKKTAAFARKSGKPCLHLSARSRGVNHPGQLRRFLREHHVRVLNVAGPRKSEEPSVGRFVSRTLGAAL